MDDLPVFYRIGMVLLLCTILSTAGCSCHQDRVPPKNSAPSVERKKDQQQKSDKQKNATKSQTEPQKKEPATSSEASNNEQNKAQAPNKSGGSTKEKNKSGGAFDSDSARSGSSGSGNTNSTGDSQQNEINTGGRQSPGTDVPFSTPKTRVLFGNKNKTDSAPLTRGEINDRMAQAEKNLERAKKHNEKKDYQAAYDRSVECWTQLQSLESNEVDGLEKLRHACLVQMKTASDQLNKNGAATGYNRTNIIEYK